MELTPQLIHLISNQILDTARKSTEEHQGGPMDMQIPTIGLALLTATVNHMQATSEMSLDDFLGFVTEVWNSPVAKGQD